MKKSHAREVKILLIIAITAATVLSGFTQAFSQTSQKEATRLKQDEMRNIFFSQIKEGVGTEIKYPRSQNAEKIREAVISLSDFIRARSGFEISTEWQAKIAELEQKRATGAINSISTDDLSNILAEVGIRRIERMTDEEIEQIAGIMREGRDYIALRADGRGSVERNLFIKEFRDARAKAGKNSKQLKNELLSFIKSEINNRVSVYSRALPEQFGKSQSAGLPPIQAVLLTYSVISDDWLQYSQNNLEKTEQDFMEKSGGTSRNVQVKAFGEKGSRFSSPLNILLDQQAINDLVTSIERKIQKK